MKCNSCGVLCKCKLEKDNPAALRARFRTLKQAIASNVEEQLSVRDFIVSAATKKDAETGRRIWLALKEVNKQLTRLYTKAKREGR